MKTAIINWILIMGVYVGVRHYTGHHCIALAAICALFYLKQNLETY